MTFNLEGIYNLLIIIVWAGGLIAIDISEYSYSDDFSKIVSSVKKEARPNSGTDMLPNTLMVSSSSAPLSERPKNNDDDMPDGSQIVYVTATGKWYHYDSTCNGGEYTLTTLEDAKWRGLSPCQKCVLR